MASSGNKLAARAALHLSCSAACLAGAASAVAQTTPAPAAASLPEVRVEARGADPATERASVGGFGEAPISRTPQALGVIRSETLRDLGVESLSAAIRTETSAADAYNTLGYVETIQVRGFVLDNALNFRRDGLAISNHAPVAFENKESVEILKGVSGIQGGVSAPGGLVNYVLKRPTAAPLRDVLVGVSERGTALAQGDFGGRLGADNRLGYRINLAAENRHPEVHDAPGNRRFVSGFFDLRLPGAALLEAEFENHRVRQRSVPGFGLIDLDGDGYAETLPGPIDPRINMNSQPWSQPFESESTVGSIRFQQALSASWSYGARYGQQRISTNDRLAFPDGCSSGPSYVYPGFCGNYDFDVYDYRSENERRQMQSAEAFLRGDFATGALRHEFSAGLSWLSYKERFEDAQAYNWVGVSNVFRPQVLPENPDLSNANTDTDMRRDELYLTDVMRFERWSVWLGVRHTRLTRSSELTDGSEPVRYEQSFTTPWGAVGYRPWDGGFAYLSAGTGVETEVVPNRPLQFVNYGQVLPALESRQVELGYKQVLPGAGLASVALFEIRKPYSEDVGPPGGPVLRVSDGREARHRGLEASWAGRPVPSLALQAQATLIDAKTTRSLDPALEGQRTTNVAPVALSLLAAWQVPGASGLTWTNQLAYAGRKTVTSDGSIELPSYWQLDTGLTYRQRMAQTQLTWRLSIDNLFDRRYWREAPTQYWGATYLFPAMPRTLRASVQASF